MNIYNAKPYVYKIVDKESGEFYIGYREANTLPANEDFGRIYKTSSPKISERFDDFIVEEIIEFESGEDAYDYENILIEKHWGNPKLLNKHFHKTDGKTRFRSDKEVGEKISKSKRGNTVAWNKGRCWSDEERQKIREGNKRAYREGKSKKPDWWTGRVLSEEHRRKIGNSLHGRASWNSKRVHTPKGVFRSSDDAAKDYGISKGTMRNLCSGVTSSITKLTAKKLGLPDDAIGRPPKDVGFFLIS